MACTSCSFFTFPSLPTHTCLEKALTLATRVPRVCARAWTYHGVGSVPSFSLFAEPHQHANLSVTELKMCVGPSPLTARLKTPTASVDWWLLYRPTFWLSRLILFQWPEAYTCHPMGWLLCFILGVLFAVFIPILIERILWTMTWPMLIWLYLILNTIT